MSDFAYLKAGDPVVLSSGGAFGGSEIAEVERVTATQIIVRGKKFRRSNGGEISGGRWARGYLEEATKERVQEITDAKNRRSVIGKMTDSKYARSLTTEQLMRIDAIMSEGQNEQN